MQIYKAVPCLALLLIVPACFGANGDQLLKLDADRNDLLKQITNELSYGKMSLADAQRIKSDLDQVVTLETLYKQGKQVQLSTITLDLARVRKEIKAATQPQKVWMGIDSHNKALRQKIDAAFAAKKLTKDEADNLGQEEQILRNRETVNDAANGLEYDDAISIAKAIQQLDTKIDHLSKK